MTRRGMGITVAVAIIGLGATGCAAPSRHPPATDRSARISLTMPASPLPSGRDDATAPGAATGTATALPVSLTVPAIGVSTALQPLALLPDGTLQPPSQWQVAGWYAEGVRPGDPGPAVIAGHVDSVRGPAIFFNLHKLKPGDAARIVRADGTSVTYLIDTVREYPKDAFPTEAVYGPTALPVLRLVTCTGDFDYRARSYLDNLVVSAHLVAP